MPDALEPPVAQVACRHFDGHVPSACFGAGVEVGDVQSYFLLLAERADKPFVAVRLGSAQVEVAVCGLASVTQCEQHASRATESAPPLSATRTVPSCESKSSSAMYRAMVLSIVRVALGHGA